MAGSESYVIYRARCLCLPDPQGWVEVYHISSNYKIGAYEDKVVCLGCAPCNEQFVFRYEGATLVVYSRVIEEWHKMLSTALRTQQEAILKHPRVTAWIKRISNYLAEGQATSKAELHRRYCKLVKSPISVARFRKMWNRGIRLVEDFVMEDVIFSDVEYLHRAMMNWDGMHDDVISGLSADFVRLKVQTQRAEALSPNPLALLKNQV